MWPDPLHDLGQPILAQGDGVVVHVANSGWNNGAGAYLEVDYGDVTVTYVHLIEGSIPVEVGDEVVTGQTIGELGNTGRVVSSTAEKLAHLDLAYWDSSGMENARAYLLSTQLPVRIEGVDYVATPGEPAPPFTSTNCEGYEPYPFDDVSSSSFARDDIEQLHDLGLVNGIGDGRYDPASPVTREQMAAFLARLWRLVSADDDPVDLTMPFGDVDETSFAYADVGLIARYGITTGTGPGEYSPEDPVTREQMAAFLARLWRLLDAGATELPEELDELFDDVPDDSFAHDDVLLLAHLELTTGVAPGTYDPYAEVTREQMAAFIARLYRLLAPGD